MSTHEKFGLTLAYIDTLPTLSEETKNILKGLVKEVKCEAFNLGYDVHSCSKSPATVGCAQKDVIKDIVREVLREQQILSSTKGFFNKKAFWDLGLYQK